jgi:hypothetical protein
MPKVRLLIRKRTIEPIAAAHNDLFVGYVSFGISKRKQLVGADFVAFWPKAEVRIIFGALRSRRARCPMPRTM